MGLLVPTMSIVRGIYKPANIYDWEGLPCRDVGLPTMRISEELNNQNWGGTFFFEKPPMFEIFRDGYKNIQKHSLQKNTKHLGQIGDDSRNDATYR